MGRGFTESELLKLELEEECQRLHSFPPVRGGFTIRVKQFRTWVEQADDYSSFSSGLPAISNIVISSGGHSESTREWSLLIEVKRISWTRLGVSIASNVVVEVLMSEQAFYSVQKHVRVDWNTHPAIAGLIDILKKGIPAFHLEVIADDILTIRNNPESHVRYHTKFQSFLHRYV